MSDPRGLVSLLRGFFEAEGFWVDLVHDILFVIVVVALFSLVSKMAFGLWTPMMAIESGSMEPHIMRGDIVVIQSPDKNGIFTHSYGLESGYVSFGDHGDVIVYHPYGRDDLTPVIHRAMYWVEEGEPMWDGGPPAPHSGYITKGDNQATNKAYDQMGGISYHTPVKREWVVGVACLDVPYIGYLRLAIPVSFYHLHLSSTGGTVDGLA